MIWISLRKDVSTPLLLTSVKCESDTLGSFWPLHVQHCVSTSRNSEKRCWSWVFCNFFEVTFSGLFCFIQSSKILKICFVPFPQLNSVFCCYVFFCSFLLWLARRGHPKLKTIAVIVERKRRTNFQFLLRLWRLEVHHFFSNIWAVNYRQKFPKRWLKSLLFFKKTPVTADIFWRSSVTAVSFVRTTAGFAFFHRYGRKVSAK